MIKSNKMKITKIKIGKAIETASFIPGIQKACPKDNMSTERYSVTTSHGLFLFNEIEALIEGEKPKKFVMVKKRIDHRIAMLNDGIFTEYYLLKESDLKRKRERSDLASFEMIVKTDSKFHFNNRTIRNSTSTVIYL